jgi:hypothetical protein
LLRQKKVSKEKATPGSFESPAFWPILRQMRELAVRYRRTAQTCAFLKPQNRPKHRLTYVDSPFVNNFDIHKRINAYLCTSSSWVANPGSMIFTRTCCQIFKASSKLRVSH